MNHGHAEHSAEGVDKCPQCGSSRVSCYGSRSHPRGRRRSKRCAACDFKFYTVEIPLGRHAGSDIELIKAELEIACGNLKGLLDMLTAGSDKYT